MLDNQNNRFYRIFDFLHEHVIAIIIAVVVIAGIVSTFVILNENSEEESKTSSESVEYVPVDTIYFAMDHVKTVNPLYSQDRDVYYMSKLVYSSLFELDKSLNITKGITDTYTADPIEGSVSIKLKSNVKFSDGSQLTADDVRFTVDAIKHIGSRSPYYRYVSKIDYVYVKDSLRLEIRFEDPYDAALDNLVFPVVSSQDYSSDSENVKGSGQYYYKSYDGNHLILKPNKHYYGEKAENTLKFRIVPDKSKTTGLMTTEAITAYVSREEDMIAEDKGLNVTRIPSPEAEFIGFNCRKGYTKNKEIRKAIALAIDRNELIEEDYGGDAIISDSIYFPEFLGLPVTDQTKSFNQRKALQILKYNGFYDSEDNERLIDYKGKTFTIKILVNSSNSSRTDAAFDISEMLSNVGIKTEIKKLPWSQYKEALKEGNFDIYLGGYKFDKQYNLNELFGKNNNAKYKNKDVQMLVRKLETALSAKQQKELFAEIRDVINDELPYYCLCYKTYSFITVPHFSAETEPVFFDVYRGCSTWEWEKAVKKKK